MNGVLLVEKPTGFTSFDCVEKIKDVFEDKTKVGHAGNLDKFSSGILPIMIGKATKLFKVLIKSKRTYLGEFKLGVDTDTGDINGKVITSDKKENITKDEIVNAFTIFEGGYLQKDHYKKQDGDSQNAEKEEFVELYNIDILNIEQNAVIFYIEIGEKFDIKSYLKDVSSQLNTVGRLNSLKRIKFGEFQLKNAINLMDIKNIKDIKNNLIGIKKATSNMSTIKVNEDVKKRVLNGNKLKLEMFEEFYGFTRILSRSEKVLAIGKVENGKFDYISVLGEVV